MSSFFQRLKQRKLVQWALAYLAVGWVTLQVLDFLRENFGWSAVLVRSLTLLVVVGFFITLVLAWYHGERGRQRITALEALIILGLLLMGVTSVWVASPNDGGEVGARRRALSPMRQEQLTFLGDALRAAISPDGRSLAYVVGQTGELTVRDLEGGPSVVLDSALEFFSLEWSPGGSHLLYSALRSNARTPSGAWDTHLYVSSRYGGGARRVPALALGRWAPDGERVLSWAERSDTLRITNLATSETRDLELPELSRGVDEADWSPRGDRIALLTQRGRRYQVSVRSLEDDEQIQLLDDTLELAGLRWAPDGASVYYFGIRDRVADLWKLPTAGKAPDVEPELLLSGLEVPPISIFRNLTLTADGRRLAYTRWQTVSNILRISLVADDGVSHALATELTTGTAVKRLVGVTADGRWILFADEAPGGRDLFRIARDGQALEQLTFRGDVVHAALSPDGEHIALGALHEGKARVWLMPAEGGSPTVFAATEMDPDGEIAWAPGPNILYQRLGGRNFHSLDPLTAQERPLLTQQEQREGWLYDLAPAPDGESFVAVRNLLAEGETLWWMSQSDGRRVRLPVPSGPPIAWSSDGTALYYLNRPSTIQAVNMRMMQDTVLVQLPRPVRHCLPDRGPSEGGFLCESWEFRSDVWQVENFDPDIRP